MSCETNVSKPGGVRRFWAALGKGLAAPLRFLRRQSQWRRDVRHLEGLDDHHLRDIGLRRDQIDAAVTGLYDPRYGKIPTGEQRKR